jgi:hypothetical protein
MINQDTRRSQGCAFSLRKDCNDILCPIDISEKEAEWGYLMVITRI